MIPEYKSSSDREDNIMRQVALNRAVELIINFIKEPLMKDPEGRIRNPTDQELEELIIVKTKYYAQAFYKIMKEIK
ncbi:MAG: hypothetical protein AABY22_25885 [Nanoarchaeota archaeon]